MARYVKFIWTESDSDVLGNIGLAARATGVGAGIDITDLDAYRLQAGIGGGRALSSLSFVDKDVVLEMKCDLPEDIQFEVKTSFKSSGEIFGVAGAFVQKIGGINNLFSGTRSDILNIFDVPVFDKTEPFAIQLSPILYTRTSSILDVYLPAMSLTSLTILKAVKQAGKVVAYKTPGVFLGNAGKALTRPASDVTVDTLKKTPVEDFPFAGFVTIEIENLVKFQGIMTSCKPKFSRHMTTSGGPLWCMLDMQIQTFLPASSTELFTMMGRMHPPVSPLTSAATTIFS